MFLYLLDELMKPTDDSEFEVGKGRLDSGYDEAKASKGLTIRLQNGLDQLLKKGDTLGDLTPPRRMDIDAILKVSPHGQPLNSGRSSPHFGNLP
jgi:hypothetical protein